MDQEYDEIYEKLKIFLIDSIDLLKKDFDITKIPQMENAQVRFDETTNTIQKENSLNWYQLKIPMKIIQLDSYFEVIKSLEKHPIMRERNEKMAYAFESGNQFKISSFPIDFLKRLIVREKKIEFNTKTFTILFEHFLNYSYEPYF